MLRIPLFWSSDSPEESLHTGSRTSLRFPRNVIIFITGVRISDRRYCWIRSRSSPSRFCIECKILIYTLLLNQHSPLPLFIFLLTIQMIPFYSCCYLHLPAPNICLMQNAPALPKIPQHRDAFLPLIKTFGNCSVSSQLQAFYNKFFFF